MFDKELEFLKRTLMQLTPLVLKANSGISVDLDSYISKLEESSVCLKGCGISWLMYDYIGKLKQINLSGDLTKLNNKELFDVRFNILRKLGVFPNVL